MTRLLLVLVLLLGSATTAQGKPPYKPDPAGPPSWSERQVAPIPPDEPTARAINVERADWAREHFSWGPWWRVNWRHIRGPHPPAQMGPAPGAPSLSPIQAHRQGARHGDR